MQELHLFFNILSFSHRIVLFRDAQSNNGSGESCAFGKLYFTNILRPIGQGLIDLTDLSEQTFLHDITWKLAMFFTLINFCNLY